MNKGIALRNHFRLSVKIAFLTSLLFTQAAYATVTRTGAAVRISQPVKVLSQSDLEFGLVRSTNEPGMVTLDATGQRTLVGCVSARGTESTSQASFILEGNTNSFALVLPPAPVALTNRDNHRLIADKFTSRTQMTDARLVGIGATVHVGADQPSGVYTGTFDVTISYN